jgi:hypothetical protein
VVVQWSCLVGKRNSMSSRRSKKIIRDTLIEERGHEMTVGGCWLQIKVAAISRRAIAAG